jgi:hypothetical protein
MGLRHRTCEQAPWNEVGAGAPAQTIKSVFLQQRFAVRDLPEEGLLTADLA